MKLVLVDGYSLLYRAYYSSPPLRTREGMPTGALYGFLRMLFRLLDDAKPDYLLIALDAAGPTFRHTADETYKATRSATPDDLAVQTDEFRPLLDELSIPHYERSGFEADDVLGTLARHAAGEGMEVTVVTGDTDTLQLVEPRVQIMLTRRGVTEMECYDHDAVLKRFGFEPTLLPDYRGLRGDTSDNIPGVPGIGEKTAQSLVAKFGGLESLYQHLDEVTPPRMQQALRNNQSIAFHSRDMSVIVTDLPLEVDLAQCRYQLPLPEAAAQRALAATLRLEFKNLATRFMAGGATPTLAALTTPPEVTLQDTADAGALLAWIAQAEGPVALVVVGQRLALGRGNEARWFRGSLKELAGWLGSETQLKIVHDAKSLHGQLAQFNLPLSGVADDTLLMAYLLDPARQWHPLPLLADKYLRYPIPEIPAALNTCGPEELFQETPPDALQEMALYVTALAALPEVLTATLKEVEEWDLYHEVELPLVDMLVEMEACGMQLDPAQLHRVSKLLEDEAARLQKEIWELAGEEFNIGSTRQLQQILYGKLALTKGRSIKTGHSTDAATMEKLAEDHEIVRKILDYRAVTKLKTTYTDALLAGMDQRTHRIHTSLNQTGAVSGRLSSSNPNLQNIPIRTEQGRQIRKAFVAPPGMVMLRADYSQIELRLLAHLSGDQPLVEAFQAGTDVHTRTAASLFQVPPEQVDAEMRRKAKMTNYAIAYGVSGFGLARQLGIASASEGQKIINEYFRSLPGVKHYIDASLDEARRLGYVKTLMGRRRPLPEIVSPRQQERGAAERVAINHPLQGSAADILKLAMLAIRREMQAAGLKSRLLLQVHDELVFEAPPEEVDRLAEMVDRLMRTVPEQALQLKVPLVVDIGTGPNWNDTVPWTPGG